MFNKLFFVLYSALILCFSPLQSLADESNPTWQIIRAGLKDPFTGRTIIPEKRVFGTYKERQAAWNSLKTQNLSSPAITKAQNAVNKANADYTKWAAGEGRGLPETYYPKGKNFRKNLENKLIDAIQTQRRIVIDEIDSDSLIRETNNKAKKAEDARLAKIAAAKKIEDARLAKIAAAAKKIEDARLAKIAAAKKIEDARLAKIAADKVIEDARLAKIAAEKEEKRLAKIAADKVIEDARLAKIAADKVIEDARLAKIAAEKEEKRLAKIAAEELKKQQAYAYKVKMEGEPLEKRLEDPVFAKKYKEDQIKLGWMLERKQIEEEEARIKEENRIQRLEDMISIVLNVAGNIGTKDPNKITSITKDGLVRTLYCNPGPCTPGSVKLHEYITGLEMGVDVNTLAKRIETNAAQKKRQDNTNENNAKTAEGMASLGNVSLDTLFEQSEADLDETNDISFARAQSIPLAQRIKNREAYTDYVRSAAENEAYCLYEGGC